MASPGATVPTPGTSSPQSDAEQPRTVVIAPDEVFAPTSYARARLLRQMHASGVARGAARLGGDGRALT